MMRSTRLAAFSFFLIACAGADGATGPQGPAGPQGPQGPAGPAGPSGSLNFFTASGVTDAGGDAAVLLPTTVPSTARPILSCYITNTLTQPIPWIQVADGNGAGSGTICGLVLSAGRWSVALINAPAVWFYFISVTW
jgi:hypothetical protein